MITGFNTDIEFQGTTYHVQTEDKGVKTPLILSLVYDRGTILASKRSAYDDLLIGNLDEKILAERLQKQHNLICAAVRTGRIEDLKRMAAKDSAAKHKTTDIAEKIKPTVELKSSTEERPSGAEVKINDVENFNQAVRQEKIKSFDPPKVEKINDNAVKTSAGVESGFVSKPKPETVWDVPISIIEESIVEVVQLAEEDLILSAEAVEIISDYAGSERVADAKLKIKLLNDESFKGGDRKTICILVNRGDAGRGLSGAQVMVKILGSSFRPLIFHAKTDAGGVATVHLQVPHFKSGRAALLIKAMSEGEETDLRRIVSHD